MTISIYHDDSYKRTDTRHDVAHLGEESNTGHLIFRAFQEKEGPNWLSVQVNDETISIRDPATIHEIIAVCRAALAPFESKRPEPRPATEEELNKITRNILWGANYPRVVHVVQPHTAAYLAAPTIVVYSWDNNIRGEVYPDKDSAFDAWRELTKRYQKISR